MITNLLNAIRKKNILSLSELRQYLWKDEINDPFLLTKHMELYLFNDDVLGCYCWNHKIAVLLRKKGVIFNEWSTSDGLYTFRTNIENLPLILSLGKFKRRPDYRGRWITNLKDKLGHDIRPYESVLVSDSEKCVPLATEKVPDLLLTVTSEFTKE